MSMLECDTCTAQFYPGPHSCPQCGSKSVHWAQGDVETPVDIETGVALGDDATAPSTDGDGAGDAGTGDPDGSGDAGSDAGKTKPAKAAPAKAAGGA